MQEQRADGVNQTHWAQQHEGTQSQPEPSLPMKGSLPLAVLGLVLFIALLLLVIHWRYGYFYLDGGYYVSAGYGVAHGMMPYVDFFFPQGPVYPYVYGVFHLLFGSSVQVARAVSLGLSVLIFLAICVYYRNRMRATTLRTLAIALLGINSFVAFNLTVEKLNALTGFWLLVGCLYYLSSPRSINETLSAAFLTLAVLTRFTLLPAFLLICAAMVWEKRKNPRRLIIPTALSLSLFILVLAPFLITCAHQFFYDNLGIHVSAGGDTRYHFGLLTKLGAFSQLLRHTWVLSILGAIMLTLNLKGSSPLIPPFPYREKVLWAAMGLALLTNAGSNWFHAAYQVMLLPVVTVLMVNYWARISQPREASSGSKTPSLFSPYTVKTVEYTIIMAALLTVFGQGRSFMWFDTRGVASPFFEQSSKIIRSLSHPNDLVLSDQPLIVHQAGRGLIHGLEGAPFSFTPWWSAEKCAHYATINREMLIELLKVQTPAVLALTEKSFSIGFPGFKPLPRTFSQPLWDSIFAKYKEVARIQRFGGTDETLLIFARKGPSVEKN